MWWMSTFTYLATTFLRLSGLLSRKGDTSSADVATWVAADVEEVQDIRFHVFAAGFP